MSTKYPYQIYHLDHELLIQIEREKINHESDSTFATVVSTYKSLMSNRPRNDPTIRECFGTNINSLENSINQVKLDVSDTDGRKMTRKIKSCKVLLSMGFYQKVADVDAATAQLAIDATTSINSRWMFVHSKNVVPTEHASRSTSSYDLILRFDEWFLIMPLGFIDLQENDYAIKLV